MDEDDRFTAEALADLVRQLGGEEELAQALEQTELPVGDAEFQHGAREGIAIGVLVASAIRVLAEEPNPAVRAAADAIARAWAWAGVRMMGLAVQLQQVATAHEADLDRIQGILRDALAGAPAGSGSDPARDVRREDLQVERGPDEET